MQNSFLNFLFLLLYKHHTKHMAVFIVSTLLVGLLASFMFLSSSIKHDALISLHEQPDFTIKKIRGGRSVDLPVSWVDDFSEIKGISYVAPRVFGRYYLPDRKHYFTIVGVDFFDEQLVTWIKKLSENIDIKKFLAKDQMIIGDGVKKYLSSNYYDSYFNFFTPDGEEKKVYIFDTFAKDTNLISNDLVLVDINLARKILGISQDKATDIILDIPNPSERSNIKLKLLAKNYDTKIITKSMLEKEYENLFNYKGGIFLLLFTVTLITFMLILFQRYSMINNSDKKEIAILRSVGWSIKDVIKLKILETLSIAIFAFLLGVILAYLYVFYANAPLLRDIFIGFGNLQNSPAFTPVIDFGMLSSMFLFFIIPFIASILIPVWKIAITDPNEALK